MSDALGYPVRALLGDRVVAESTRARVVPTDAGPALSVPRDDVRDDASDELPTDHGDVLLDPTRFQLEVLDGAPGADPRDVTVKRFPVWGDVADLVRVLDVQPDGPGRYVSHVLSDRPGHVEGSQMLAQSMVAAGRSIPGRRVISAHMAFFRAADPREPLEFAVDELSNGRTMAALAVRVSQSGKDRAAGTILLDVTAPDLLRHQDAAPPCAGPYDSPAYDMAVLGRDIRVVDGAYDNDPDAPVGPPVIDTWVRFRDVPHDPDLHTALLVQFTGHQSIAAAMRPHAGIGQAQAHRTISTGINAIAVSMHAPVRADTWMRYHHRSTFAGDGMTHSECRVYTEDGTVVASFAVDAMVRAFSAEGSRRL